MADSNTTIVKTFYVSVTVPAALSVLPARFDTPQARLMMLACAGQESGYASRIQTPGGQARSFWQIEKTGMLRGVMHSAWWPILASVCEQHSIPTDEDTIFEAIAWHDPLAYAVARLGLWMDPNPLPAIGDVLNAYNTYLRVWRPGKPSWMRWQTVYPAALAVVKEAA